jgi:hypothetical protein
MEVQYARLKRRYRPADRDGTHSLTVAGVAQSVQCLATDWAIEVRSRQR